MKISSSPNFYRLGAVCCAYYVAAQLFQEISFHFGINDSAGGEAEILQRRTPLDQFRLILILLGFSLIPIITAYAGVALRRYRARPAASLLGFAFAVMFVGFEASTRSIDFFLISRKWAVEYRAATLESVRQVIGSRIQVWDDAIAAFYFALLGVHMLSSLCFAVATWDRDKWDVIVALGFWVSAMESVARLSESYLGQSWVASINSAAYLPVVLLSFGTLAIWLWRQAKSAELSPAISK